MKLEEYVYNPEKATALLKEAGWDSTRKIDFLYYYSDQVNKDIVVAIQSYLAAVGMTVEPRLVDGAGFNQALVDKTFLMGYAANGQGLDPSIGALITKCGTQRAMGYCNKRVDELSASVSAKANAPSAAVLPGNQHHREPELPKVAAVRSPPDGLQLPHRRSGRHFQQQPLLMFDTPIYNEIHTWYTK